MTRVETKGSVWLFDGQTRYCRMPKEEKPRKPEWGGPEAGPLQDLVWHDCLEWFIDDTVDRLIITIRESDGAGLTRQFLSAPDPVVVS